VFVERGLGFCRKEARSRHHMPKEISYDPEDFAVEAGFVGAQMAVIWQQPSGPCEPGEQLKQNDSIDRHDLCPDRMADLMLEPEQVPMVHKHAAGTITDRSARLKTEYREIAHRLQTLQTDRKRRRRVQALEQFEPGRSPL